jgi:coniferyl-aldehyde dehydrogenase
LGELAEARRLFERQHQASRSEPAPALALRQDRLGRLGALVAEHARAFSDAIGQDFGTRARAETELLELAPTLGAIRHAAANLSRWMKPERRHVSLRFRPGRAWVRHEPLGVIGIISPWNYPLQLALAPVIDALAAGNRVMVKPSELTPAFSGLLRQLMAERFDPAELAVVTGGVELGQAFAALPFDHLLFTGSTTIGRKVYQAAAANLTPVTLELGGKSPALVARDYPIAKAARSIAWGKFINAGQTCIAPDYVLAPREQAAPLARAILDQAQRSYPAVAENDQYSAIISPRHQERLLRAIAEGQAGGAELLVHEDAGTRERGKIGPTILLNVPADSIFLSEEIFGPVLPIVAYDRLEDAIAFINARERPLALYCFSGDARLQARVLDGALSGGVTLNGTILHVAQEDLPFGGVGPSGIGAYHGREGFRRFSHARAVHKIGFFNAVEQMGPPWGKLSERVLRAMLKR